MKITQSYKYQVEIQFILNNKSYELRNGTIKNIVIDHDYDNKNMPIIFCQMTIDLAMYKTILENENNGKFLLIIKKKENNSNMKTTYIKGQFKYFIPTNRNEWNTEFVNKSGNETQANTAYKETVVGLMSEDIINNNSKMFNGIYSNTTSFSLVQLATKDMKMVIEPFKNNYKLDQFVVPPMESINDFLSFVNDNYPFYDTPYRYFIDFNQTYLISSSGNYIDKNDTDYKSINIDINNRILTDDDEGVIKNTDNNSYYINTYLTSTSLKVNIYLEYILNLLNTIDVEGIKNEELLQLNRDDNTGINKRYNFRRVNNIDTTTQIKNDIENSIVSLSLSKANVDTSILTPNKIYIVNNFKDNKKYNGKYILTKKRDIFNGQTNYFESVTSIELKRIKNA